eukprot:TRINITY_DN17545_c0_g1_i1.p1 TRINITY_DN17545_c0_g1~~TRINITY_DN17545_c0_g1_i1.p1  ORF type:complete len:253 (+),score=37.14 TRINITY_DN17545_c0_g1_i1:51-809(+)
MSLPPSRSAAEASFEGYFIPSSENPPTLDRTKEELVIPDTLMDTLRRHSFVLDIGAAVSEPTSTPEEEKLGSIPVETIPVESDTSISPSIGRKSDELQVRYLSDSFSLEKGQKNNLLNSSKTTLLPISPDVAALDKAASSLSLPITPGSVLLPPSRQFGSSPLTRISSSNSVKPTSSFSSYSKCPPLGRTFDSSPLTPGLSDLTTQCTEDISIHPQTSTLSLTALTKPPPGHPATPMRADSLELGPLKRRFP